MELHIQSLVLEFRIRPTIRLSRVSVSPPGLSGDIPVKPKDFAKNQNEDHSDIHSGLLHIRTNALRKVRSDGVMGQEYAPHPRLSR